MKMLKGFFVGVSFGLLMLTASFADDLRGTMSVNITSDTAANAKNIAFDEARRQIISDSLRQYVDVNMLSSVVANAKASELTNLIASSTIDNEQTSDTTYSAKISMVLDMPAVRVWLQENGVQNWLPDDGVKNTFTVVVGLSGGLADWIELNRIARSEKVDLGTKNISGNSAVLALPVAKRGAFTIALREMGWRYANKDGALHIWK